ncbi:glycosyl transferase family 1, partial [Paraburkholderia tropica]
VNMYDYFQEASNVTSVFSKNWLHYWRNECGYTIKPVSETNDIRIYDQQQFIMYAHFADEAYQKIDYINYFDTSRRKIKRELYDTRGFLSCVRVLSTDQKIQAEYYLSPQGNVKIEKYYDINSNHPYEAKKIILNHLGKTHFLNNETELGAFFIETIYQNSDLFFSDRNLVTSHIFNIVASYI